jgi:hypothetical protein
VDEVLQAAAGEEVTEERFKIEAPRDCEELFFFERAYLSAVNSMSWSSGMGGEGRWAAYAAFGKELAYAMLHEWRQTRACLGVSHLPAEEKK